MEASCLELALEGERLCKAGDFKAGAAFFEAAVQVGTEDLKTLSAIYSQLGNAYFYLKEYSKALEYHKHDLTLARTIGDRIGEAKASGNLGNTLKILGQFDEAIVCSGTVPACAGLVICIDRSLHGPQPQGAGLKPSLSHRPPSSHRMRT
uniref:Uncharacterized protein n=1 Tax=Chelydra serpentina TaxID=8475 RepID=A0A8C3TKB8_CHESE